MIDKDEYPQTAELERRCVSILADLWHAPDPDARHRLLDDGVSEACMLGGLALKRRWRKRRAGRQPRPGAAQPGDGRQRPGLLGEVLQLLGRRAPAGADGAGTAST